MYYIRRKDKHGRVAFYGRDYSAAPGGVMIMTADKSRAYRYASKKAADRMAARIKAFWRGTVRVVEA